jgi:hypothetical protein
MTKDEALKLALEALEHAAYCVQKNYCPDKMGHDWDDTIASIKEALAQPPLPVQRQPLTGDRTTFEQRFSGTIALMCGAEPPAEFVDEWLRNVEVNFVARLQEWVLNQDGTPRWAQGIVVLDAAYLLADSPEEGMQHEEATHNIGAKP